MTVITAAECHDLVHGSDLERKLQESDARTVALIKEKTDAEITVQSNAREIERLNNTVQEQRERIAKQREMISVNLDRHQKDIATIGEAMLQAASENDFCNVYDETVEALNKHLSIELPTRKKQYTVDFSVQVTVTCSEGDLESVIEDMQYELRARKNSMDTEPDDIWVGDGDWSEA